MIEVLKAHQPETGHRDLREHCTCGIAGPTREAGWQIQHQAEQLKAAGVEALPLDASQATRALLKLLDIGKEYSLGGTGDPVGIVVLYPKEAFINASWGGDPTDRMKALVDAAASEGMKDK